MGMCMATYFSKWTFCFLISSQKLKFIYIRVSIKYQLFDMYYAVWYDFLLFVESPESTSHYSCKPSGSRESTWVIGSKTPAKWGWERRKSWPRLDLKCIKEVKLLRKTQQLECCGKKGHNLQPFFMVIYSIISKHYMLTVGCVGGCSRGDLR